MTDSTEKETNEAQASKQIQPPLIIAAQFIKDLSFEAPDLPKALLGMKGAPSLDINVDIKADHLKDNTFEVVLKIKVQAKSPEAKVLFVCELAYAALAQINVPQEHVEPMLLVEVPRLLFPFARQIIADLSKETGMPPVVLSPIDFFALFKARMEQKAAQNKETTEANNSQLN